MEKMKTKILAIGVIAVFAFAFSGFYSGNVEATLQDPVVLEDSVEFGLDATATAKCINGDTVSCSGNKCSANDAYQDSDGDYHDGSCKCDDKRTDCPSPLKK